VQQKGRLPARAVRREPDPPRQPAEVGLGLGLGLQLCTSSGDFLCEKERSLPSCSRFLLLRPVGLDGERATRVWPKCWCGRPPPSPAAGTPDLPARGGPGFSTTKVKTLVSGGFPGPPALSRPVGPPFDFEGSACLDDPGPRRSRRHSASPPCLMQAPPLAPLRPRFVPKLRRDRPPGTGSQPASVCAVGFRSIRSRQGARRGGKAKPGGRDGREKGEKGTERAAAAVLLSRAAKPAAAGLDPRSAASTRQREGVRARLSLARGLDPGRRSRRARRPAALLPPSDTPLRARRPSSLFPPLSAWLGSRQTDR